MKKLKYDNQLNPLTIVDIGASGGIHPRWQRSKFAFKGILFEPDPREYDNLKASLPENYTV